MLSIAGLCVATYINATTIDKPTIPLTTTIEGKEIDRKDIEVEKYIMKPFKEDEEWIDVILTAYTSSVKDCGNNLGRTASGTKVSMSRGTAAFPKSVKFQTKFYIPQLKTINPRLQEVLINEDTGGAIKFVNGKMKIDVYIDNQKEVEEFGVKHFKAKIIK